MLFEPQKPCKPCQSLNPPRTTFPGSFANAWQSDRGTSEELDGRWSPRHAKLTSWKTTPQQFWLVGNKKNKNEKMM
jgi:hypothetical protein